MKLNQKGAIDMMLVAALVVVLVVGGFVLMRISNSDDTSSSKTANTASADNDAVTDEEEAEEESQEPSEPSVVIGDGWKMDTEEELTGTNTEKYSQTDGTASLRVFSSNPEVFYSSNAPVKCVYENGAWVSYINRNSEGYVEDGEDCEARFTESDVEGVSVSYTPGGALGQYKYISVFNVGDSWYVVQDFVNTITNDGEDTAEEVQVKQDETISRVESLVQELIITE